MYADLDVDCLRPFDRFFSAQIATSINATAPSNSTLPPLYQIAFFGRMGSDFNYEHSIPNAWMASTPFHPFFLLPVEAIAQRVNDPGSGDSVETLTGPIALRDQINWYESHHDNGKTLIPYLRTTDMDKYFYDSHDLIHSITLLAPEVIYPFSWTMSNENPLKQICSVKEDVYDSERCKDELGVRENGGYCITYWTHTWASDGHNEGNLAAVAEGKQKRWYNWDVALFAGGDPIHLPRDSGY
jgi:hypothetical protein